MDPQEIMNALHTHAEFAKWKDTHPNDILAHIFLELDNIQIGYFDPERSTMTTFVLGKEVGTVHIIPDQEILRGDSEITPIKIDEIRISPLRAQEIADASRKTNYPSESIIKSLSIIQNIDGKCVYNITYFTASFKTINIKVSTIDGSVVRHTIGSLIDVEKGKRNFE